MTEKLYNTDSYLFRFECRVLSAEKTKTGYDIVTDRTAFFPEAGGQTCDKGTLGGHRVNHVRIEGDTVIHEMAGPLSVGALVEGIIDREKRFSDMQQHTGEHIVSGLAHKLYGCENVGFHLGSEIVTVDFDKKLSPEQVAELELRANKAVTDNLPVTVSFPSREELALLSYRSKKELEGEIRIVTVEGIDTCACCAPHVELTGEIGLVRVVGFENYKGGVRLSILCGERAVVDIREKLSENRRIGSLLSAKENETFTAVSRLKEENESLKREMQALRGQLLSLKAEAVEPGERVVVFEDTAEPELLRELCIKLKEKAGLFSAVIGCENGQPLRYVICGVSCDARTVGKAVNNAFGARGGGRQDMVQGTVSCEAEMLRELLATVEVAQ